MAEMFQFDLVAPERRLASGPALEVELAGSEGDITVMADHAPLLTTLRPGVLRVKFADGTTEYAVTGGFADISPAGVTVLAEQAVPLSELTQDVLDRFVADAVEERDQATADQLDLLAKRVSDLAVLGTSAGLSHTG
jgi:F-type H+-transporting ATPase subunit epsilon